MYAYEIWKWILCLKFGKYVMKVKYYCLRNWDSFNVDYYRNKFICKIRIYTNLVRPYIYCALIEQFVAVLPFCEKPKWQSFRTYRVLTRNKKNYDYVIWKWNIFMFWWNLRFPSIADNGHYSFWNINLFSLKRQMKHKTNVFEDLFVIKMTIQMSMKPF